MAIDATAGGSSANCYVTLAGASTWFEGHMGGEAWELLDLPTRERALRHATANLDGMEPQLKGKRLKLDQALAWPRHHGCNTDLAAVIPPEVVAATCLEAAWLARHKPTAGKSQRQQLQEEGVTSFSLEGWSETFKRSNGDTICPDAYYQIKRWIKRQDFVLDPRERLECRDDVINRDLCCDDW